MADATVVKELLQFLKIDAREDCKLMAIEHISGLSGSTEGISFINDTENLIDLVAELTRDKHNLVAKHAYAVLINSATNCHVSRKLLDMPNFPITLLRDVTQPDTLYADGICSLLINLSHHEDCAQKIIDIIIEHSEEVGFDKIIQAFCTVNFNEKCALNDLGPFLQNLSQIKEARKYIMDKERCVIQRLLPFTEYSDSAYRRKGIVGVLKNCCFETEFHDWLLSKDVDILPRLLLPLAGPEEFDEEEMDKLPDELQYLDSDKERESDLEIRKMLVEAVIRLCSTEKGRAFVKSKNTYLIMREYEKWEKDEDMNDTILECISLLVMDEPEEGMGDLEDVEIPEDLQEKFNEMERKGQKVKSLAKTKEGGGGFVKF